MEAEIGGNEEDVRLMEGIAEGERRALEQLYAKHHKRVFLFIRRFESNIAIAEDLANDVFLDIWDKAASFEGRSKVSSWILGMARFKALSEIRKRRNTVDPDDVMGEMEDEGDTPEVAAQKKDKGAVLMECVQRLSQEHRIVVDLIYYQEQSIKEAAEVLQVPENTIKTRMFHARKKLSEMMSDAGLDRGWP